MIIRELNEEDPPRLAKMERHIRKGFAAPSSVRGQNHQRRAKKRAAALSAPQLLGHQPHFITVPIALPSIKAAGLFIGRGQKRDLLDPFREKAAFQLRCV